MNFFKFFDELTVSWCSFSVKTVPPLYFSLILIKQKDFLWQTVHFWILICKFGSIWLKMKDIENNNTANFCEFIMNLFCNTTKKYLKFLKHLVCHQECIFSPVWPILWPCAFVPKCELHVYVCWTLESVCYAWSKQLDLLVGKVNEKMSWNEFSFFTFAVPYILILGIK